MDGVECMVAPQSHQPRGCSMMTGGPEEWRGQKLGEMASSSAAGGSVWTAATSLSASARVLSRSAGAAQSRVAAAGAVDGDAGEVSGGERGQGGQTRPESPSLKRRLAEYAREAGEGGASSPIFERLKSPRCHRHPPNGRSHSPVRDGHQGGGADQVRMRPSEILVALAAKGGHHHSCQPCSQQRTPPTRRPPTSGTYGGFAPPSRTREGHDDSADCSRKKGCETQTRKRHTTPPPLGPVAGV